MKDEGLEALVALEPQTVALLLNYWNEIYLELGFREAPAGVVILYSGEVIAVTPRLGQKKEHSPWIDEFFGIYTESSYYNQGIMIESLVQVIKGKGLANSKIGFEMGFIPAGIMDLIRGELPQIQAVDGEWILWQFRAVKTPKQLSFIKTAVGACEAGIKKMLACWKEGESIHRLIDMFEQTVRENGASFHSTYQRARAKKWIDFKGRDQYLSEDFKIRANDVKEVLFDLIVKCQAYISDWKRSFYLGTPPREISELYEFEWRFVQTIAKEIKPGMNATEACEACEFRLKKESMVNWWCVHSVGLEIHEEPLIGGSPFVSENGDVDRTRVIRFPGQLLEGNNKITFDPNVVVMVETMNTEDPYIMTGEGLKRLNTLPQKLFVV
jgi:Xaa-Pro aminopeptidase